MEYQKITKLLGSNKQIRFNTSMLRSDLCHYFDAYILVKRKITVTNPNNNAYDEKLALKNNAPFISCISKINVELIENAEDLDIVCLCIIYLNTAKIIEKLQDLCLIIREMSQIVVKVIVIIE